MVYVIIWVISGIIGYLLRKRFRYIEYSSVLQNVDFWMNSQNPLKSIVYQNGHMLFHKPKKSLFCVWTRAVPGLPESILFGCWGLLGAIMSVLTSPIKTMRIDSIGESEIINKIEQNFHTMFVAERLSMERAWAFAYFLTYYELDQLGEMKKYEIQIVNQAINYAQQH